MGDTAPILFTAIDAYARRVGIHDPDEFDLLLRMIRAMDDEVSKVSAEQQAELPEARAGMFGKTNVSERPMSPALFDAVFPERTK